MGILTRYVLADLGKVFLICLAGLTMLMIVVGIVREAVMMESVPMGQVVRLIPYILPEALRFSVPVTLLLATTYVYGRMSGCNEIVALKATGISPLAVLWPTYVVAFLLSLAAVWLNDMAVSWGRNGVSRVAMEAVEEIAYARLRSQRSYSTQAFSINVRSVADRRLIRPTLTLHPREHSPSITISADEAELHADHQQRVLRIVLRNGTFDVGGKLTFQFPDVYEQEIPLEDASRAPGSSATPSWLALWQIPQKEAEQRALVRRTEQDLAVQAAYEMLCGDFNDLTAGGWEGRMTSLGVQRNQLCRLLTEPHRRWSAGFSCLCFAWVGAPMAIRFRNRDFLTSFFLCFLPILIIYYPLLIFAVGGAKSGSVPPYTVWLGNVLLLLWGTWLLRRVMRY